MTKMTYGAVINDVYTGQFDNENDLIDNILKDKDYNTTKALFMFIHIGLDLSYTGGSFYKNLLSYVHPNSIEIRDYTNICPTCEYPGITAVDRQRYNLDRTSVLTDGEYISAMEGRGSTQFWSRFKRRKHLVNMRSLVENKTMEFRCFYVSLDKEELMGAINFSRDFVSEALRSGNRRSVCQLLEDNEYKFPRGNK